MRKEEPWYRWSYRVETVDEKAFWERVWIRAQADGQCVFVPGEAGEWNAVKERTKLSENTENPGNPCYKTAQRRRGAGAFDRKRKRTGTDTVGIQYPVCAV